MINGQCHRVLVAVQPLLWVEPVRALAWEDPVCAHT